MTEKAKQRLLAVVGPTASGKSRLAVELAKRLGGEILSCDSMQIYRDMDIGTAKPTEEEMQGVPHYLIDFADPHTPFSCADYVDAAKGILSSLEDRGVMPILCGGTGLYLDRLLMGGTAEEASPCESLREELRAYAEREGRHALHERLAAVDPESALQIHENNLHRVLRALEIYETTGIPKSVWDRRSKTVEPCYGATVIGLRYTDRELLYARINERVDVMMREGLLDETEQLLASGVFESNQTAAQAIGYKELFPYLNGEASLEDCIDELKRASRRYAKRQITWFSGKEYAHKVFLDDENGLKEFEDIVNNLKKLF